MGASFQAMTVEELDRTKVKAIFAEAQRLDRYENGHSYSGGFGMASGLEFRSEAFEGAALSDASEIADDWLMDRADKWGPAIAVAIHVGGKQVAWRIGAWCSS